eukprot:gnl/Chilomastix_caulleri/5770.p2 GENE.gnl/Chilomastix_caulleri/5770~~gnl/Chilomastix_caulleri/5770.p2  ORF type:complete len:59 (+),score=10.40 gnl/Chilomastix_caulleri/5770:84-260(+)
MGNKERGCLMLKKGATTEIEDELEAKTRKWSELYHHLDKPGDGAAGGVPCWLKKHNER